MRRSSLSPRRLTTSATARSRHSMNSLAAVSRFDRPEKHFIEVAISQSSALACCWCMPFEFIGTLRTGVISAHGSTTSNLNECFSGFIETATAAQAKEFMECLWTCDFSSTAGSSSGCAWVKKRMNAPCAWAPYLRKPLILIRVITLNSIFSPVAHLYFYISSQLLNDDRKETVTSNCKK